MFEKITLAVFNNKCFYLFKPYLPKESNKRLDLIVMLFSIKIEIYLYSSFYLIKKTCCLL